MLEFEDPLRFGPVVETRRLQQSVDPISATQIGDEHRIQTRKLQEPLRVLVHRPGIEEAPEAPPVAAGMAELQVLLQDPAKAPVLGPRKGPKKRFIVCEEAIRSGTVSIAPA